MTNSVKDTVYKLLTVMDSETQIRKYLKRFSSDEGLKFAVIKVGGKILKEEMENLSIAIFPKTGGADAYNCSWCRPSTNCALG